MFEKVLENYEIPGTVEDIRPFRSGHINDTLLVSIRCPDRSLRHTVLQKINKFVFKKPWELMENAVRVTEHIRKKVAAEGGDTGREVLSFIPAKDGKAYAVDEDGEYWRLVCYIDNAACCDLAASPELFKEAGRGFGKFQSYLADFPAETLHETIPHFHDTRSRFRQLQKAVKSDRAKRAESVSKEIAFYMEREHLCDIEPAEYEKGRLKKRVTHNDTKLNNVMIDNITGKALCVLDLDTVMPGFSINDFGDAIRFGASTAKEDEEDVSKVQLSLELYEAFTEGFLETAGDGLLKSERMLLPHGARNIIFEQGMRFFTDYLEGDVYFKTEYPEHNLVRARTHIKLLEETEEKWEELKKINSRYL